MPIVSIASETSPQKQPQEIFALLKMAESKQSLIRQLLL